MRNTIAVIDRYIPKTTIQDLSAGQMFRYPKSTSDSNIYMRVDSLSGAVLLATGAYFSNMKLDAEIEVIDAISIIR